MRMVFSALSLLIVVAIVGLLAKKQLGAVSAPPAPAVNAATGVAVPTGTPKQQLQQVQKAIEAAQPTRTMPDEDK